MSAPQPSVMAWVDDEKESLGGDPHIPRLDCNIQPNLEAAKQFLTDLCGDSPITLQTFSDRKDAKGRDPLARVFHGSVDEHSDALRKLQQEGAGVFVQVNEGDGHGRRSENVVRVRAVFVDLDGTPLDSLLETARKAGCPPSFVVESSPGKYHVYWRVCGCPLDQFSAIQEALAEKFNADPACKDLARVLRLPGFIHQKDQDKPFLVRVILDNHQLLGDYPADELVTKLGLRVSPQDSKRQPDHFADCCNLDSEPNVKRAIAYLESAEPAIEGDGGDNQTYKVACKVRDFGISQDKCLELMEDHWNDKCQPPWGHDELTAKVANAYRYAEKPIGADTPEAVFEPFEDQDSCQMRVDQTKAKKGDLPPIVNLGDWTEQPPPEPNPVIMGLFDIKDKFALIGSSKTRKSFFLLQFIISIASGRQFLNWSIPRARRVILVQYEITEEHYQRRVYFMCKAMGISKADIGDRLHVINARGYDLTGTSGLTKILKMIRSFRPEVVVIDPLYKFAEGTEMDLKESRVILAGFDYLAEQTGASVGYVHHDAKGSSGDRDIRDRGSGSNIISRDYDACITITPHSGTEDAVVVETLLRNYPPQEPLTAMWTADEHGGHLFTHASNILPTKETTARKKADRTPFDGYLPIVRALLEKPLPVKVFRDNMRTKSGMTVERVAALTEWLTTGSEAEFAIYSKRGRGQNVKLIGSLEDIERLKTDGSL